MKHDLHTHCLLLSKNHFLEDVEIQISDYLNHKNRFRKKRSEAAIYI
jgi:hypothetical protein